MTIYWSVHYNNCFHSDVTHTAICNSISFHDHGNNTEGKNVYMEFPFNDKTLCHEECKHVKACSGYTYEDDSQKCFLSSDTMFIETSPCFSCRFYEKTCQSCMYSLHIYNYFLMCLQSYLF